MYIDLVKAMDSRTKPGEEEDSTTATLNKVTQKTDCATWKQVVCQGVRTTDGKHLVLLKPMDKVFASQS